MDNIVLQFANDTGTETLEVCLQYSQGHWHIITVSVFQHDLWVFNCPNRECIPAGWFASQMGQWDLWGIEQW
jgi:hypothetical protein